jgi:glycosyltransferase involved in cell wall biosynthesis
MELSIITINRNNVAGLEKTIQSVVSQTFRDFEYIIIDGASNDGSIEIIKNYSIKITYWVSEPDNGAYHAMNKGIKCAHGDFCLFLNSGDWLVEKSTLKDMLEEISRIDKADIYYSDCIRGDNILDKATNPITVTNFIFGISLNHQNAIISRSLFIKYGYYNEKLLIVADREFFLKALWLYKAKFQHIKTCIAVYDITGGSSQVEYDDKIEIMLRNVFGDLADLVIEARGYHNSIYYDIITRFGNSKLLTFLLKAYRYIIKRLYRILRRGN